MIRFRVRGVSEHRDYIERVRQVLKDHPGLAEHLTRDIADWYRSVRLPERSGRLARAFRSVQGESRVTVQFTPRGVLYTREITVPYAQFVEGLLTAVPAYVLRASVKRWLDAKLQEVA